ncbi:hypothetical protein K438DRAFT_1911038 [Mycena galopus ATCC 62051]|nr:hypothetical protein K438DRAFT_1911038 [Mycena galopus ATCC 62051]
METERGVARGSYIWGRSVNNTRIERPWYDVTHGFGFKWKRFFIDLEVNHNLNPTVAEHIWLLHYLFLHCINEDAQEWAEAWNWHDLQIRGEWTRCPHDIFFFSQLQDGPCGLERMVSPLEEEVEDPSTYGIDWDVRDDSTLMQHHLVQNPEEWDERNPFSTEPLRFLAIPLILLSLMSRSLIFDRELAAVVDLTSRSMTVRKLAWQHVFEICTRLYNA